MAVCVSRMGPPPFTMPAAHVGDRLALFEELQRRENFLLVVDDDMDSLGSTSSPLGGLLSKPPPSANVPSILQTEVDNKNEEDWLYSPPERPLFPCLDEEPSTSRRAVIAPDEAPPNLRTSLQSPITSLAAVQARFQAEHQAKLRVNTSDRRASHPPSPHNLPASRPPLSPSFSAESSSSKRLEQYYPPGTTPPSKPRATSVNPRSVPASPRSSSVTPRSSSGSLNRPPSPRAPPSQRHASSPGMITRVYAPPPGSPKLGQGVKRSLSAGRAHPVKQTPTSPVNNPPGGGGVNSAPPSTNTPPGRTGFNSSTVRTLSFSEVQTPKRRGSAPAGKVSASGGLSPRGGPSLEEGPRMPIAGVEDQQWAHVRMAVSQTKRTLSGGGGAAGGAIVGPPLQTSWRAVSTAPPPPPVQSSPRFLAPPSKSPEFDSDGESRWGPGEGSVSGESYSALTSEPGGTDLDTDSEAGGSLRSRVRERRWGRKKKGGGGKRVEMGLGTESGVEADVEELNAGRARKAGGVLKLPVKGGKKEESPLGKEKAEEGGRKLTPPEKPKEEEAESSKGRGCNSEVPEAEPKHATPEKEKGCEGVVAEKKDPAIEQVDTTVAEQEPPAAERPPPVAMKMTPAKLEVVPESTETRQVTADPVMEPVSPVIQPTLAVSDAQSSTRPPLDVGGPKDRTPGQRVNRVPVSPRVPGGSLTSPREKNLVMVANALQRRALVRRSSDRSGTMTPSDTYEWERSSMADETYSDVSTPSTMLSRRLTEEAREAAVICSSVIHDIIYEAARQAQEKDDLAMLSKASGELKRLVEPGNLGQRRSTSMMERYGTGAAYSEDIAKLAKEAGLKVRAPRKKQPTCGCTIL